MDAILLARGWGKIIQEPPFLSIFFFFNESRAICRSSLKANSDEVGESNVQSFLLSKLEKSINKCNVSDLGPQAQSGVLFLYFLTHRTWQPSPLLSGVAGKGGRETCEPPGQRTAALRSSRVKVGELRRRRRKKKRSWLVRNPVCSRRWDEEKKIQISDILTGGKKKNPIGG